MVKTRQIDELIVEGRRLGRHVAHDPRSRDYLVEEATTIHSVQHASTGLPLDQVRGSCTAEALLGSLNTMPDFATQGQHVYAQPDAESLYDEEIRLEGYDPARDDPGGTGLYVCQAAKKMGLIRHYRHAFSLTSMLRALVIRPGMVGSNWYDSMDHPDSRGLVTVTPGAQIRGGHEYVATEIDVVNSEVGFWNSWGPRFGVGGRFRMSFATLERLLGEEGDYTVPYV